MNVFRMHILLPIDEETIQAGVYEVKRELEKQIQAQGLDQEIMVIETGTAGLVGRGVIMTIYPDQVTYYGVTRDGIDRLVSEHLVKGRVLADLEHDGGESVSATVRPLHRLGLTREQKRVVLDKCFVVNPYDLEEVLAHGGYRGIEKILSEQMTPDSVVDVVKRSGLRGRGGAGFPTGLKWGFTRSAAGSEKYMICNADEGEPGTFKDRLILEGDPHKLIEGMAIAGYAIGAGKGFIYIRGEYDLSIQRTQKAIDDAREAGLLGQNILGTGFSFDLEIKKGAGAYVCGEETALIESLEGGRGNPRIKPPFPAQKGLWQKPTCVNNVETLANVPDILFHGADWYRSMGTEKCPGTKVFTILGHVEYPGLIEVEMGTSLREIIFKYAGGIKGGRRFKAALVGGAAGVFLSEKLLDVPMDYESLKEHAAVLGSGAILVMNEDASVLEMLDSVLHFFEHESCGQCSPCRIGTKQPSDIITAFKNGEGSEQELEEMVTLSDMMLNCSLCPLGQSLIMPVKSAVEHFREEFPTKYQKKEKTAKNRRKI